jgi:hypothetical protein
MTVLPLAGKRVLVLDADGVLRRFPDGETLEGVRPLEGFLREEEFRDVVVVAAGQWKCGLRMHQIRALFADDVRDRFVGVTPEIRATDRFRSHVEIQAWLEAHPEIGSYLVLESVWYWRQLPALERAVFVSRGAVLGPRDLDAVRYMFRKERQGYATVPGYDA